LLIHRPQTLPNQITGVPIHDNDRHDRGTMSHPFPTVAARRRLVAPAGPRFARFVSMITRSCVEDPNFDFFASAIVLGCGLRRADPSSGFSQSHPRRSLAICKLDAGRLKGATKPFGGSGPATQDAIHCLQSLAGEYRNSCPGGQDILRPTQQSPSSLNLPN
jgi:hypothetical protein